MAGHIKVVPTKQVASSGPTKTRNGWNAINIELTIIVGEAMEKQQVHG